jgi:hypothetical protein
MPSHRGPIFFQIRSVLLLIAQPVPYLRHPATQSAGTVRAIKWNHAQAARTVLSRSSQPSRPNKKPRLSRAEVVAFRGEPSLAQRVRLTMPAIAALGQSRHWWQDFRLFGASTSRPGFRTKAKEQSSPKFAISLRETLLSENDALIFNILDWKKLYVRQIVYLHRALMHAYQARRPTVF